MVRNLILLGAPGVGKGTQAVRLNQTFGWAHISTGDILRNAVQEGTELGRQAKSYMDKGELVSDSVIIGLMKDRIQQNDCRNGFVLDGFPRTVPQAEQLENVLEEMHIVLDGLISIEVPDWEIVKRLTQRIVCNHCGFVSTSGENHEAGTTCGHCDSGQFIRRQDDNIETIQRRLTVYQDQTRSLIDFYRQRGKLITINGSGSPDEIYLKIQKSLEISSENV